MVDRLLNMFEFYFQVLLNMLEYVKYYVQITLHVLNFNLKYC
jgi:hypothetical protein